MKRIYPWMAPIHKAQRTLYNHKLNLKYKIKYSCIVEAKNSVDVIVHTTTNQKIVTSFPNTEASYKAER